MSRTTVLHTYIVARHGVTITLEKDEDSLEYGVIMNDTKSIAWCDTEAQALLHFLSTITSYAIP